MTEKAKSHSNQEVLTEAGKTISRNSLYNIVQIALCTPATFATLLLLVSHLSPAEFGIWSLVGVIVVYAQFADFGIAQSIIKYVAQYRESEQHDDAISVLRNALYLYFFLGSLVLLLCQIGAPFIMTLLRIPMELTQLTLEVLFISLLAFLITLLGSAYASFLRGCQRMEYTCLLTTISQYSTLIGTSAVFYQGGGLVPLAYNSLAVAIIVCIGYRIAVTKITPQFKLELTKGINLVILRNMISFGWKILIANFTQLFIFHIDRFLISRYVGIEFVGYYEIASRIAIWIRSFIVSIFIPLLPAASMFESRGHGQKISEMYQRAFKYMLLIILPIGLAAGIFSIPLSNAWLGESYYTSTITLNLLLLAYLLNMITAPGAMILNGIGIPQYAMRSSIMAAVINVVLSLILVKMMGYYGVIYAIIISISISGMYFLRFIHRFIETPDWFAYYRKLISAPLILIAASALVWVIFGEDLILVNKWWLSIIGTAYFMAIYGFFWLTDYLDEFDRQMVRSLLAKITRVNRLAV